ncbi:LIM domain-binding protein 1-A-like isoform X2 [Carcharodon carcharias]|uniref:LIM domain-binding protein 1-A-like isoform X2 n=1 Tax=Carcharodon carcharias TaxID=13397 RepID=UPI001B7DD716|nr:LIM domain-binding protein 1-A-like isoform X2 [Carcharodon carcharias]
MSFRPFSDSLCSPTPMYLPTYLEPGIGRHTPYMNQTDYRIFELNKRLQNWAESQDLQMLDQLSKNITRCGLSNSTLNYLRLCVILEPMQELMSRHKTYSLSPRDCLKTCLFQKWQRMVAPPERARRRQRILGCLT